MLEAMNKRQNESNHSASASLLTHRGMSFERLVRPTVLACLVFEVHQNFLLGHLELQLRLRMIVPHPLEEQEGVTLSLDDFRHLLPNPCHLAAALGYPQLAQTTERQPAFLDVRLFSLCCRFLVRICILLAGRYVYENSLLLSVCILGMSIQQVRRKEIYIHHILANVENLPGGNSHDILYISSIRRS